ncbi:hypothetical protein HJFPF1_10449 [Paramyrothecium foliicola]|nr:hypothetical protein HJFPF1_10449 [Paramyrothecium foliicola]
MKSSLLLAVVFPIMALAQLKKCCYGYAEQTDMYAVSDGDGDFLDTHNWCYVSVTRDPQDPNNSIPIELSKCMIFTKYIGFDVGVDSLVLHRSLQANTSNRPEEKFVALCKAEGKIEEAAIATIFDQLKPIKPEQLIGEWEGGSFDTGHPAHGMLQQYKWAGKNFRAINDVDPMILYGESGQRYWSEEHGNARLREVNFRGVVSAAMIYDKFPIIDSFRFVTRDLVCGAMDSKQFEAAGTYYFYLRRIGAKL